MSALKTLLATLMLAQQTTGCISSKFVYTPLEAKPKQTPLEDRTSELENKIHADGHKSRRMNLYKFPASSKRGQPYTPLRTRSRRMSVIRTSHTSLEAKPRQMSVIRVQHFMLATKDRISKLENKKHANGQKSRRIPTTISLSLYLIFILKSIDIYPLARKCWIEIRAYLFQTKIWMEASCKLQEF